MPDFAPDALPFRRELQTERYALDIDGGRVEFGAVSVGNPHAVLVVPEVASAPVDSLGPILETHRDFPNGVGETRACGTGACAAMVVARSWSAVEDTVVVELTGGELLLTWSGPGTPVCLTGPAEFVFDGSVAL